MITQPDITKSTQAAARLLQNMPGQVRYAASRAINAALRVGLQAEQQRMGAVFDRPTPYTLRGGVSVKPSDKANLVGELAIATVATGENVPPGKPLLAEVRGGARRLKRSEVLLQRAGLLPQGWLTVPGRGAKMDGYGNIQRGQILQILSWFAAYPETNSRAGRVRNSMRDNSTAAGRAKRAAGTRNRAGLEYFAVQPGGRGGLSPGIYARQTAGKRFTGPVVRPRAVLVFVQRTQYAKRFDFVATAQQAIATALPEAFTTAFRQALETAR